MDMDRRKFLSTAAATTAATAGVSREAAAQEGPGENTVGMFASGSTYFFDPIGLHVEKGTTVTFAIESGAHSSTAYKKGNGGAQETRIPEGAKAWDSGTISGQGSTFKHTFKTPGTYDYFCIPHKSLGMVGRIVVGEPGGPAEGSMPPDGDVPESQTIVDQGSVSYASFSGNSNMGYSSGGGGNGGGGSGNETAIAPSGTIGYLVKMGLGVISFLVVSLVGFYFLMRYGSEESAE
ncbi:MAG: plastocyanin/azurin family copper-binding protein [Halobacteria archaeon]|nr:plastocyanin/azurin family copper-binding protein [Halobacteria archaeon]